MTSTGDGWLDRRVARMPVVAVTALAIGVYALWGLVTPFLLGASTAWLLSFNTQGAIFAGAIVFARLLPVLGARLRRQRLELTTDLRLLSAGDFEQLVGEMFRHEGWDVIETGRHGEPDGGIDLRLRRGAEHRLVQCKRWISQNVGVDEIRKLGGSLLAEGLPGSAGLLVTTSRFTKSARNAAEQLGLEIIDGQALVPRLQAAGATQRLAPPKPPSTPWACSLCGNLMVLDRSRHGWWLRCPAYGSGCKGKLDLGSDPERALDVLRRET